MKKFLFFFFFLFYFSAPSMAEENIASAMTAFDNQDYDIAFSSFSSLAEKNDAVAQVYLGRMYSAGYGRIPPNQEKAFFWYEKAAKQNLPAGLYNLGSFYFYGNGMTQNPKKALYFFRKAAFEKYYPAQMALAVMYENGLSIEKNFTKAYMWCIVAVKNKATYAKTYCQRLENKINKKGQRKAFYMAEKLKLF